MRHINLALILTLTLRYKNACHQTSRLNSTPLCRYASLLYVVLLLHPRQGNEVNEQ